MPEAIDGLANSPQDYFQKREQLSLQYYGCEYKWLTPTKKANVSNWVRNRSHRDLTRKEQYQMPVQEELRDYYERTYREDETSINRRIDLKRAFENAWRTHLRCRRRDH